MEASDALGGESTAPQDEPGTSPAAPEGAQQTDEAHATPTATDEPVSEEEANPAADQSPVATERQGAIVGDPGVHEQQPVAPLDNSADTPVASSAPPPSAQSGVPLAEDRAAGVEPGPSGPISAPHEEGGSLTEAPEDTPEHDGSEGQSATPPLGG